MYSFRNDYSEGAHPQVLQALTDTNLVQTCGYGVDPICEEARDLIRTVCAAPEADVHFLVGGTQTNLTVITALLASYEAVIAAHTGHVNCHETGAIEATGHKVCVETSPDGKVTPAMVEAVLARHDGSEHMVSPKMVYISDTTEIGTVYTKAELTALRHCCDEHGLLLFLDGARLGSALTSPESDLTLADLAALERERCSSLDAPADAFAKLLALAAEEVSDPVRRRVTAQLLYHLGRWVYLVDAADDLRADIKSGGYNPLALRFTPRDGALAPADSEALALTLDGSVRAMAAAFELLPETKYTPVLRAAVYEGLYAVGAAVLHGTFRKRQRREEPIRKADTDYA